MAPRQPKAHHEYWNVSGLKKSQRTAEKERTPSDCSGLVSKGGAPPSFRPCDYTQETTNIEQFRQASHSKKKSEKNLKNHTSSDVLPVALLLCFNFSLTTSLSFLSQPVHGESEAFACSDSGLSWQRQHSFRASCTSWHISRAMWQLKATLASSQSSRKRNTLSPDQCSPMTCRARLSTMCSRKSDEERPFLSDHVVAVPIRAFLATVSPHVYSIRGLTSA